MTAFNRGDVVLVGFVFADESGRKLRPAVVLSTRAYQRGRQEVIVAAITSNLRRSFDRRLEESGVALPFRDDGNPSNDQTDDDRSKTGGDDNAGPGFRRATTASIARSVGSQHAVRYCLWGTATPPIPHLQSSVFNSLSSTTNDTGGVIEQGPAVRPRYPSRKRPGLWDDEAEGNACRRRVHDANAMSSRADRPVSTAGRPLSKRPPREHPMTK